MLQGTALFTGSFLSQFVAEANAVTTLTIGAEYPDCFLPGSCHGDKPGISPLKPLFLHSWFSNVTTDDLTSKEKRLYDKFKRIAEQRNVKDGRGVQGVVDTLTSDGMKMIPVIFIVVAFSAGFLAVSSLHAGATPVVPSLISAFCFWAGIQNYRTIQFTVPKIAQIYLENLEPKRPSKKKRKRLEQQAAANDS